MSQLTMNDADEFVLAEVAGDVLETKTAGEAMDGGTAVYLDSADGKVKKAWNASADYAACYGITLHPVDCDGQPVRVMRQGTLTIATTSGNAGKVFAVDDVSNKGKLCEVGDIGSGEYITIVGVCSANDTLIVSPMATGTAKA